MKEKPILFSTPMVRAILSGQKTMTRRVVTPQPDDHRWRKLPGYAFSVRTYETSEGLSARFQHHLDGVGEQPLWVKSPYGNVGDCLWVRESWRAYSSLDHLPPKFISQGAAIEYLAGGTNVIGQPLLYGMGKSRPSIFMPRWASRITLEITGVKVERLNQISNEDILREGIRSESCNICVHAGGSGCDSCFSILKPFRELWDSINGKTPGKFWDDNPYVWAVSFKRM